MNFDEFKKRGLVRKTQRDFQLIKDEWKINYQLIFKEEEPERNVREEKERTQEEMKKINNIINEIKRDYPEFSDNHESLIKYKAKLRALYELIN